jgi:3-carboxy-cis,cis-muconate cycloisomerase
VSVSAFDDLLTSPELRAIFDERSVLRAMLRFEQALARAQAEEGVIPESAADAIAGACKADLFDSAAIVTAGAQAGSLAIALVKELTQKVSQADSAAAGYVHWGSTSQDVIDTALALLTREALAHIDAALDKLIAALFKLASAHADTPVLARTLLQPAQVITFGFKVTNWLAPLLRSQAQLRLQAARALALQLGGAAGTLAAMGPRAPQVARRMAQALGLTLPPSAWHTQRDEWVRLGLEVAVLVGSLGKIAGDLALMAQGEIGELAEPAVQGRGGSSAMPHKRNPVAAMIALAAAHRAPQHAALLLATMGQQHERGLGNWQAELAEWPLLFLAAHGAAKALAEAMAGLEVNSSRMRQNIDAQRGLIFAEAVSMELAQVLGRPNAHRLMEELSRKSLAAATGLEQVTLEALGQEPRLRGIDPSRVTEIFDPVRAAKPAADIARGQLARLRRAVSELPQAPWPPLTERQESGCISKPN